MDAAAVMNAIDDLIKARIHLHIAQASMNVGTMTMTRPDVEDCRQALLKALSPVVA